MPGIHVEHGVRLVDEGRLLYPGDLLHDAGHLAVTPSALRGPLSGTAGDEAGEEMAAIAWSYAAALHLKLDLTVVFHADGYQGGSHNIITTFSQRPYAGVPPAGPDESYGRALPGDDALAPRLTPTALFGRGSVMGVHVDVGATVRARGAACFSENHNSRLRRAGRRLYPLFRAAPVRRPHGDVLHN
ncbi:MAG TPA: hypothetical protein VKB88_21190, partial [Bryobacteraceae bacterium]|nr:hypothetical protein [Bryobacteraceae bacterium]